MSKQLMVTLRGSYVDKAKEREAFDYLVITFLGSHSCTSF